MRTQKHAKNTVNNLHSLRRRRKYKRRTQSVVARSAYGGGFFSFLFKGRYKRPRTQSEGRTQSVDDRSIPYGLQQVKRRSQLGEGSEGTVYAATWCFVPVVVKVLKVENIELENVNTEVDMSMSLFHPNIVKTFGWYFDNIAQEVNIILEECNTSLHEVILKKALTVLCKAQYLLQVASALHSMHERNILHRDLKAANVLIGKDGLCKICDFGLFKHLERGHPPRKMTGAIGTHAYMHPDIFTDDLLPLDEGKDGSIDIYSFIDIYAFGILICFVMSGQRLYQNAAKLGKIKGLFGIRNYVNDGNRPWHNENEDIYWNDAPSKLIKLAKTCCDVQPARSECNTAHICTTLETIIRKSEAEAAAAPAPATAATAAAPAPAATATATAAAPAPVTTSNEAIR